MNQRDNILQELIELQSSLAERDGLQPPYQVPAGYFNGLADEILKRIRAFESDNPAEELENLSPLLNSISKKMPYAAPAGYFDGLGKNLEPAAKPGDIQRERDEHLSPLLTGLKNKLTYTVPPGYFENLPATITEKINRKEVKVVSLASRKWFHYAAAAVVVGFIAVMGLLLLGKNDIDPVKKSYAWVKKSLKKVSTDDISEFVELAAEEKTDVAKLDTKNEISNLLK